MLPKSWVRSAHLSPPDDPSALGVTAAPSADPSPVPSAVPSAVPRPRSLCCSPPADAFYVDPLGPQMERPKTGAKKRLEDDDFEDEVLGDDLLPE